ncbi:hypothetical protein, partial [Sinorhizobium fredii]
AGRLRPLRLAGETKAFALQPIAETAEGLSFACSFAFADWLHSMHRDTTHARCCTFLTNFKT